MVYIFCYVKKVSINIYFPYCLYFYQERALNFVRAFFAPMERIMIFLLKSVNIVNFMSGMSDSEATLESWDKSPLAVVSYFPRMGLYSGGQCFS